MKPILKNLMVVFTVIPQLISSQSQNVWYFGNMAGLDFNTDPPVSITSNLEAQEGTASTCSVDGELLFYSDGATVWDRQHQVMPNGHGLAGGASSAQAALIVPLPSSCHVYYLFTTEDHFTDGGLAFSIVDMCLNGGLGDVMSSKKNITLENRTAENLTAVRHGNGRDIWILAHKLGSNAFHSYLLTPDGLNTNPIISAVGSSYPTDAYIGSIKANQAGNKIVSVASFRNIYEMFDFNNLTGVISNVMDLKPMIGNGRFVYGISFAPNDSLLYLSTFFVSSDLIQLNLHTMQVTNLQSISGNYHLGALQLGPDGKLYLARTNQSYVDVIRSPNVSGTGCNYDPGGQPLIPGSRSQLGLPNTIPYSLLPMFQAPVLLPADTTICDNEAIEISLPTLGLCNASYLWEDGTMSPERSILHPGLYRVEVITSCGNIVDSILVTEPPPVFFMIPDVTMCAGDTLKPEIALPDGQYLWTDLTDNNYYQPDYTGLHWLEVSDGCSSFIDTFYVTLPTAPAAGLRDSFLCHGDTLYLPLPFPEASIEWSTGDTSDIIEITKGGEYWAYMSNLCGDAFDTFHITEKMKPDVSLRDTMICEGSNIILNAFFPASTYLWSDQSMDSHLIAEDDGMYWVFVENICGIDTAEMTLMVENCDFNAIIPNVFSPNGDGKNDFIKPVLSQEVRIYTFQIFDRWGNLVFVSNNPAESWNGQFRDENCMTGVYTAILSCTSVDGFIKHLKGDITLVR